VTPVHDLVTELDRLVGVPAPSGVEHRAAAVVEEGLREHAGTPRRDAIGNVRLEIDAPTPGVLVLAHLDQVGYMVCDVGDRSARCLPVGDPVLPTADWFPALVLGERSALEAELRAGADGGADVRWSRRGDVRVGDRVVFAGALERGGGERVRGPSLDNRLGCLVALHAARLLHDEAGAVAFAWTVQEETTQAGAVHVARALRPEAVVAVDVTPVAPGDAAGSRVTLGGGPALTLLDGGMVGDARLLRAFSRAAQSEGIAWQPEVTDEGMSEAGHLQATLGLPALALLIPVQDMHEPAETADLDDVRHAVTLLVSGVRAFLAG
jgi:putative aminopeptidase FrvX